LSLQRPAPLLLFLCPLALAACSDDGGGSASAGQSATLGVTSVTTALTVTASGGTTGGGSDASDGTGGGSQSSGGDDPTTSPATTGPATTGPGTTDTTSTSTTTTGPATTDTTSTTSTTTGDGTTGECAEISEAAMNKKQPADILFVIDNSGSMSMEIASVAANMNQFSTKIIASGIDVHVVVISSYPSDDGLCIDAPLGSGGCPAKDNKPPTFLHVNSKVGSSNALQKLLDHYPDYKDVLRPDAAKHVVVVTDDNSDLGSNAFDAAFKALDPGFAEYKFHAICGAKDSGDFLWCAQNAVCCAFTADAGSVYIDLINKTGGEWGDLCLQDFTPVFNVLSTEVIAEATLACEWAIPDPMGDDPIDFGKVNVDFDDGMGNVQTIGKVETPADCANVADGWYYDDPQMPAKILVCPQTCTKIQGVPTAKMNIKFGCETVIAQ
jgi:hypothetical protein